MSLFTISIALISECNWYKMTTKIISFPPFQPEAWTS